VTAPPTASTGDCPDGGSVERLTWEDRLRVWLIEQDDTLATSSASATHSGAGLLLHREQVADREFERLRERP
jgi:hypothetical protein